MRIGSLTLHAGYNEGAILQSLSLQRAIKERWPDATAEIVDHRYPVLMEKAYGAADNDRKRALQNFYDHQLPLSEKRFYSADRKPTFSFISERYDHVVVGSDEVWKIAFVPRLKGLIRLQSDKYSPAFPNVFWPDATVNARKVSYAASVGEKTNWPSFSRRMRGRIAAILSGFDAIGVRDDRTAAFVAWASESLTERVSWTPDPTFLTNLHAEVDRDVLRGKLSALGVDFNRPRVLAILGKDAAYERAIELIKGQGYQVVTVSDRNGYGDVDLSTAALDPLEWAAMAGLFDACISERMHGCIFALKNKCPLICVDRRQPTVGFPTKNAELMRRFDLEQLHASVNSPEGVNKLMELSSDIASIPFSVTSVEATLNEFRTRGLEYLEGALVHR